MKSHDVVFRFVDRINAGDVAGIADLLTEDHKFIDASGAEVVGRENMGRGWEAYFRMVPDYRIEIRQTLMHGLTIVLLGTARGTYSPDGSLRPENAWSTPAAWRAVVKGDRIAEWQVYADNEPMRAHMRSATS